MKYLFVDESGDHNLNQDKIDPTFPFFVLTGIIIEDTAHSKLLTSFLNLKRKIFNNEKVILHSAELTRTNNAKQKEFKTLADKRVRKDFYIGVNKILDDSNFSITVFIIDKPRFAKQFPSSPPDPYFLGFSYILGVFEKELQNREHGKIFAERRNEILDKQFLLAWESSLTRIGIVTRKQLVKHKILRPEITPKSYNLAGLEVADLISYRFSRHIMGKPEKPKGNEIDIRIIASKKVEVSGLPNVQNMH